MAESPNENDRPQRHRRNLTKPRRQDMYCYDMGDQKVDGQPEEQQIRPADQKDDDDDSFSYGVQKLRKAEVKKRKMFEKSSKKGILKKGANSDSVENREKQSLKDIREKQPGHAGQKNLGSAATQDHKKGIKILQKPKKEIPPTKIDDCYVEYIATQGPKQKQPDIKIFNPELYFQNVELKNKYEKDLEQFYETFGTKVAKAEEPEFTKISWKYLMRQVQQAGKDFASEREERLKLKRKIAKFSQNTWNRMEQINEQRSREQQKKIRRQSLELMKHVKKQFWGSGMKVRKILDQQERKKSEKQVQMKKLQDLVAKQFDVSQKITKMLQGYEQVSLNNVQVSQTTNIPVIIDIQTKPTFGYLGLHEDNMIRPSLLIKFPLREYQLLGVYWISTLHDRGMNAILADEMGLGKTIQTIALFAHLALDKGVWGPHLIVVPTTILMNWELEFKRWCPAFKIMTYFGSPRERKIKRKGWSKLNSFHVCITSYKIAVTDNPIFRRKKWYYMVLDEAQNIKNFKSQRWQVLLNFKTKHRLLLTGTPLQNDLTELWSLLHFLMPKVFNSFDDFNQWFNLPFQEAIEKNFPISQQILKKLHTILRPFFLRRLKKDVEKQLPTKSQRIIRCGMSRRQRYLYDEMIWHENKKQKCHESGGMMNVLMGLKKICNHPDLFQPRIEESPLGWVPLTVVIAHHMFLKYRLEEEKVHILKDFVENFRTCFDEVAEDILKDYNEDTMPEHSLIYFKNRFMDRLFFARINYERSKRTQFRPFSYEFNRFQILEEKVPYYMSTDVIQRAHEFETTFDKFLFVVPKVMARPASLTTFPMNSEVQAETNRLEYLRSKVKKMIPRELQCVRARFLLHFPSKSIILYDSGKLVKLVFLLKQIKARGQKALVFTQMTKMLDIFEKVLNMFKFNYVRLDGGTKTELRQTIVERFNNDPRVLCFISSTRSGGIGLNLTGASNVIFYETDWNPAMDKQAQDRCHRIGQTRNVIIYRLITQHSIEENILMKSIQKRRLEELVTEEGMFDTSYFEKVNIKDMLAGAIDYQNDNQEADLAEVEDAEDREMLHAAEEENKERREEDQEDLDAEMLPKLFRYGIQMLENQEIQAIEVSDEEEADQDLEEEEGEQEEDALAEQNSQATSKRKIIQPTTTRSQTTNNQSQKNQKVPMVSEPEPEPENEQIEEEKAEPQQQYEQPSEEEVAQPNEDQHHFLSTQKRLKAMAIYQSEYAYMKQHYFYSQNLPLGAEDPFNSNEVQQEVKKVEIPTKRERDRRDRNKKKKRKR